ncbi:hypothetical protein D3C87_1089490 [compost metagenome]
MQRAETGLRGIAKIEIVVAGGDGQQCDRRNMRGGTGTRTTAQVHIQCVPVTLQQSGQLQGIALGFSQTFATAA